MELNDIILVFECKEDFIYEKPDENETYKIGETIELKYEYFNWLVNSDFLSHFKIIDIKINN